MNNEYIDFLKRIAAYDSQQGRAAAELLKSEDKTDYGKIIPERKGEPTNESLYQEVIAAAKRKFDVYPSAVANAWVVQEYKKRGGKYGKVSKSADETLEDILRHDQQHDDWHAAHGDPPCKSEEDCARMRATYNDDDGAGIKKSSDNSFSPPAGARSAAKRALKWIADGKAGNGFTAVGRKRASDLAAGRSVSYDTVKRIKAYFDRHQVDRKATGFSAGEEGYPSPGRVAWDAWGGNAAWSWAKKVVSQQENKEKQ